MLDDLAVIGRIRRVYPCLRRRFVSQLHGARIAQIHIATCGVGGKRVAGLPLVSSLFAR